MTIIQTIFEAEADIMKRYQLRANHYLCNSAQLDTFEVLVKTIK